MIGSRHPLAEFPLDLPEHVGHPRPGREGGHRAEAEEMEAGNDRLGVRGSDRFTENPLHLLDSLLPDKNLVGGVHERSPGVGGDFDGYAPFTGKFA